jgi:hypothetical protein
MLIGMCWEPEGTRANAKLLHRTAVNLTSSGLTEPG